MERSPRLELSEHNRGAVSGGESRNDQHRVPVSPGEGVQPGFGKLQGAEVKHGSQGLGQVQYLAGGSEFLFQNIVHLVVGFLFDSVFITGSVRRTLFFFLAAFFNGALFVDSVVFTGRSTWDFVRSILNAFLRSLKDAFRHFA